MIDYVDSEESTRAQPSRHRSGFVWRLPYTSATANRKDADEALLRLSDPIEALTTQLCLLTHPDLRHVARVRAFMEAMTEGVRGQCIRLFMWVSEYTYPY